MKLILALLISLNCIAQQKTVVKVLPSKDTTIVTFSTTTTTSSNTTTTYSTSNVPTIPVDTTTTPPSQPSKYEGFGSQAQGGATIVSIRTKADFDNFSNNPNGKIAKFANDLTFTGRYEFINKSYFTIDGNGFDITLNNSNAGDGISVGQGSHHVILTGIRVTNAGNDCINVVDDAHDVVIDHCSVYGGRDGNIDIAATAGKNVTVQYCILGNGNSGWAGDMLVTSQNITVHHNLFDPAGSPGVQERCPYIHCNYSPPGSPNIDFRNNLIADWGRYATGIGYKATGNFVNNYYAQNKSGGFDPNADPAGNGSNHAYYFFSGNIGATGASNHIEYTISDPYKITMTDPKTAASDVKAKAGTARKNAYEQGIINSIVIQ